MTTPDEPTTPQPPDPAYEISLCARDLWEAYGGQWPLCIGCAHRELETCGMEDWRECYCIMQQALINARLSG